MLSGAQVGAVQAVASAGCQDAWLRLPRAAFSFSYSALLCAGSGLEVVVLPGCWVDRRSLFHRAWKCWAPELVPAARRPASRSWSGGPALCQSRCATNCRSPGVLPCWRWCYQAGLLAERGHHVGCFAELGHWLAAGVLVATAVATATVMVGWKRLLPVNPLHTVLMLVAAPVSAIVSAPHDLLVTPQLLWGCKWYWLACLCWQRQHAY